MKSLKQNAVLNAVRQSMALLFPMITFPYTVRVLGTEEYGRYSFAVSFVSYFALIASFGISKFAVREGTRVRDDGRAINKLCSDLLSFNSVTTLAAYAALLLITFGFGSISRYSTLILAQSLCIILTTVGMDWLNTIYEDFAYITVRFLIMHLVGLVLIFLFVKSPNDTLLYCVIMLLSSYGGNLLNVFYLRRYVRVRVGFRFDFKSILVPTSILFVHSIATTIYVNSDITMIGLYLNDYEAGVYSFASKLYNFIKHFFDALVIVAVPRLGYLLEKDAGKYRYYVNNIYNLILTMMIPASVFLCTMSKSVLLLAGGAEYLESQQSFEILCVSLTFALLGSVYCNCILIIHKREKYMLASTVATAVMNASLNVVLIPTVGICGAAVTTILAEALNFVMQRHYSVRKCGRFTRVTLKKAVTIAATGGVAFLCGHMANVLLPAPDILTAGIRLAVSFSATAAVCGVMLFCVKDESLLFVMGNKSLRDMLRFGR